jgi:hypothetical protein
MHFDKRQRLVLGAIILLGISFSGTLPGLFPKLQNRMQKTSNQNIHIAKSENEKMQAKLTLYPIMPKQSELMRPEYYSPDNGAYWIMILGFNQVQDPLNSGVYFRDSGSHVGLRIQETRSVNSLDDAVHAVVPEFSGTFTEQKKEDGTSIYRIGPYELQYADGKIFQAYTAFVRSPQKTYYAITYEVLDSKMSDKAEEYFIGRTTTFTLNPDYHPNYRKHTSE